jgi:hypothetical protein
MDENEHRAALALTDKLVDFLEKQTPLSKIAFMAVLYTLVSTIASLSEPQKAVVWTRKKLPKLVAIAERTLAKAERPH